MSVKECVVYKMEHKYFIQRTDDFDVWFSNSGFSKDIYYPLLAAWSEAYKKCCIDESKRIEEEEKRKSWQDFYFKHDGGI